MRCNIYGIPKLEKALFKKSRTDFEKVAKKNVMEIYSRGQKKGGTPVDSNELRMSMSYSGFETGYRKEYAPHVEYGHRLVSGGFVPGQYYLKKNVDTQREIYRSDLREALRK